MIWNTKELVACDFWKHKVMEEICEDDDDDDVARYKESGVCGTRSSKERVIW